MVLKNKINVAVVGATGIVGKEFIQILQERKFPVGELKLFASGNSAGDTIDFAGKAHTIYELSIGCFKGSDVAFFSAGANISEEWAPIAVKEGAFVVDNSSAFRMHKNTALVVPEVNSDKIPPLSQPAIIANPNCSTIQLVVTLKPLSDAYGLKSVTVATYQSVSGAGKAGIEELSKQTAKLLNGDSASKPEVFAHNIAFNNLPHIDKFDESGFTLEEKKIMDETRKIMNLPDLDISATAVRTPTFNGHSEAVWCEIEKVVSRDEIVKLLSAAVGVKVLDDPSKNIYPQNCDASGKDEVFVGRIRCDLKNPKRWLMWIVSDNVRKGAALNGIQIAEKLFELKP
ncbi:MAG: aspartate-semialdehyde dehydrogenase [Oligoflexia bacterium]|nr:aspartate-semialdehyde dehydrogenase [Oligoflexia bacterium]